MNRWVATFLERPLNPLQVRDFESPRVPRNGELGANSYHCSATPALFVLAPYPMGSFPVKNCPNHCFNWFGSKTCMEQMIGNAVPINLGKYIAECILQHIRPPARILYPHPSPLPKEREQEKTRESGSLLPREKGWRGLRPTS